MDANAQDMPILPAQILHVDDDGESLRQAKEFLEGEDVGGWGKPNVNGLDDFDEAMRRLEMHRFDLVILDVRLGGYEPDAAAPDEERGVRTLREIRDRRFVPIIFWTNLPEQVRHLEGPLVRVLDKTDRPVTLLHVVRELFETELPAVNRSLIRLVEEEQRRYMWDFVAQHWNELRESGDSLALAYVLVRRLGRSLSGPGIHRLATELGEGSRATPPLDAIHAAEMYIVPPLSGTRPGAADLFRETNDTWWLLATPSCDMEQNKAEHVVLAKCIRLEEQSRVQDWRKQPSNNRQRSVEELIRNKTGGQNDRYLFLPAVPTIPDLVVDFQQLRSLANSDLDGMHRMASLANPFAEEAINRFTRYYGRVGTDDLDVAAIMTRLVTGGRDRGADAANESGA